MKKGWQTKTLGEVLEKTETVNPLQSPKTEFDYIDVSSVSNTTFQIEETQRLKGKDAPSRARKVVRTNDIIFATIRPTLQRIAVVPEHLDKQVCSTGYFILRPKPGIDHRFVFYSLFTENFIGHMESLQKGASYPAVTDGDVRAQEIPVPPLAEQQRIVGLLDEAFEGLATAKANAEKNLQNARALFESHLQSVFTQRGPGWVDRSLVSLSAHFFDSAHRTPKYQEEGIPALRPRDVVNGQLNFADAACVSEEEFEVQSKRYKPAPGDIVYSRELSYGWAALLPEEPRVCLSQGMCVFRPNREVNSAFLLYVLNGPAGREQATRVAVGAAHPHINLGDIKSYSIPLPSFDEQKQIAHKFDALATETQRLARLYERKHAALEALKKSLLHQAFNGEL